MKDRSIFSLLAGALVLLLACTGYAEDAREPDDANTRETVEAYLRADAKGDYTAMDSLFTNDARLKYTYIWGFGYEDTVYELDLSKAKHSERLLRDSDDEEPMPGYETIKRKSKITRVTSQPRGMTEVTAVINETYRYEGYEGTAKTTLNVLVRNVRGKARISRLTSVTTY